MLAVVDTPYGGGVVCLMWWGIMLDVVDMPYGGRVLCLMLWIRHTEAGYI